jgi:hypothetical protein
MRKMMIALAAAFSVCTATMTSGTPAAFARGGGSFGGGTLALVEAALEASMDTRAGSTPITAMAPVRCPLPTATPGLATDIQHRNLLSALHPQWVRRLYQPLAALRGLRRHSATYGDVTRTLLAFVGACPELSW